MTSLWQPQLEIYPAELMFELYCIISHSGDLNPDRFISFWEMSAGYYFHLVISDMN